MKLPHGLPTGLEVVVAARDEVGVPIGGGDASIAWTTVPLPAVAPQDPPADNQAGSNRSISAR